MRRREMQIDGIPAILWGEESSRAYIFVHGKMSGKEAAGAFADLADARGFQTLSFDLPEHGQRRGEPERCDIWNGRRDLARVWAFAEPRWRALSLYACSLGAYFALNEYADRPFVKCLFQSPIVDMEFLVGRMLQWFGVTEERLRAEGEIATPVDPLRWDYYQYVRAHPIERWPIPTRILYAGRDNLQSPETIERFARKFGCALTVSPESEHPFMAENDGAIVTRWLEENI